MRAHKDPNLSWRFCKYLLAILNFIASLASIAGFIYSLISETKEKAYSVLWILAGVVFVCGVIACILLIRSEKFSVFEQSKKFASGFHEILHCLRDHSKELDDLAKRHERMNRDDFISKITADCIDIMNRLSTILTQTTGVHVRSCIKLMDFVKNGEKNPRNINLITFARSGKDGLNACLKEQSKIIKVSENTDFEKIYFIDEEYEEDRKHYFYSKDLTKENEYINSDPKWQKKYCTTIVMPMRYLVECTEEKAVYDIVGFLCVDSKTKGAFEKQNIYFTIEFLKGISDIMYSYLNACVTYYKELS